MVVRMVRRISESWFVFPQLLLSRCTTHSRTVVATKYVSVFNYKRLCSWYMKNKFAPEARGLLDFPTL